VTEAWPKLKTFHPARIRDIPTRASLTWWPAGLLVVANDDLGRLLTDSSRWNAQIAVANYASDDTNEQLQAAVSTGTALELLAKACLTTISPALLADKGEQHSVLLLTGKGGLTKRRPTQLRSIQAFESLRLLKAIRPEVSIDLSEPPMPLQVRNAAAHMALVDALELRIAVAVMARAVETMLPLIEVESGAFWGEHGQSVVLALLDETRTAAARSLAAKTARAKSAFADLTAGMTPEQAAALIRAFVGTHQPMDDLVDQVECPACGQLGWRSAWIDRGPLEDAYDEESEVHYRFVTQTAFPFKFQCPVCRLFLTSQELDQFPELAAPLELDDDDEPAEDWEFEPDEDDLRGR
jgi:hypothetical protein